jgi:hypothetical protein
MKKLFPLILLLISLQNFAQKLPSISEKTANLKKYEGFMPFYWDEDTGKVWLEISKLNQDFLYLPPLLVFFPPTTRATATSRIIFKELNQNITHYESTLYPIFHRHQPLVEEIITTR